MNGNGNPGLHVRTDRPPTHFQRNSNGTWQGVSWSPEALSMLEAKWRASECSREEIVAWTNVTLSEVTVNVSTFADDRYAFTVRAVNDSLGEMSPGENATRDFILTAINLGIQALELF